MANIKAGCGGLIVDDTTMEVTASGVLKAKQATGWYTEAVQMANQADSTAVDVAGIVADFNTLLLALQTAGFMETA